MKPILPSLLFAMLLLAARGQAEDAARLPAPTGLLCELLGDRGAEPILDPKPEFSWEVRGSQSDSVQSAYQIRVTRERGGPVRPQTEDWDSGQVRSDRSTAVSYGGAGLKPHSTYWWQVRVWDQAGRASGWSEPRRIETGVFPEGDPAGDARITQARYSIQQTEVAPREVVTLAEGPNAHYFLDFGKAAYAGLKLTLTSNAPNQKVIVHLGEALASPRHLNPKPGGSIRYRRVELPLQPGARTYIVPLDPKDARRMPAAIGPVMPFRYVEIENCPCPVTRDSARQVTAHYPFDDRASEFTCSDPRLQQVWDLCKYSMKATSTFGVYVDGDRERLPYEADAYINQLGHYSVDREFSLARYSHEYLLLHSTWPTEWHLHSILMAWADYMHTGDAESLAEFYPDLQAKTLRSLAREDGLISTVQPPVGKELLNAIHLDRAIKDIVDWPLAERDGYDMRPVNTVVNAFHYRSLVLMARIAEALEKKADAASYRQAAGRVLRTINEKLFNPETGLYLDGEGSTHSSLHANMFPLAFGLVPPERREKVTAFLKSKGMACSVYAAQYLMEALYGVGEAEYARKLMVAPGDRSWAHMLDTGTTITLEAWDNKYKPNQDWNHAWGAAPANLIPRCLMGIEPLEPGFRRVRIRPQLGGLSQASITVPTIRGPIRLNCTGSAERFVADLELPANTRADVYLPKLDAKFRTVVDVKDAPSSDLRSDKPILAREEGNFLVVAGLGSGRHVLVCRPSPAR